MGKTTRASEINMKTFRKEIRIHLGFETSKKLSLELF